MNSKQKLFSLFLCAVALFASCAKLDKILVKKDGKWDLSTYQHKESIGDSVLIDTLVHDAGNITFTDNGKSIFIVRLPSGVDTMYFDWSVEDEYTNVVCIDAAAADTITWIVEESSNREQIWATSRTDSFGAVLRLTEERITLNRAK